MCWFLKYALHSKENRFSQILHKASLIGVHSQIFGVNIKNATLDSFIIKLGIDTAIADPIRRALDPAHISGQGYDGMNNVSRKARGIQGFRHCSSFKPAVVYVHRRNHTLNLAMVHSTKVRDVRNCLESDPPTQEQWNHSILLYALWRAVWSVNFG